MVINEKEKNNDSLYIVREQGTYGNLNIENPSVEEVPKKDKKKGLNSEDDEEEERYFLDDRGRRLYPVKLK